MPLSENMEGFKIKKYFIKRKKREKLELHDKNARMMMMTMKI